MQMNTLGIAAARLRICATKMGRREKAEAEVAKQCGDTATQSQAKGPKQVGSRDEAYHARSKDAVPAVPGWICISDVTTTSSWVFS